MINHGDLWCPLCQSATIKPEYFPAHKRHYTINGEDYTVHIGESCDCTCSSCGFEFTYHTEQES